MLANSTTQYGSLSKTLHWLMALIIFALIAVGIYMTGLEDSDPSRKQIYNLHKSFGVLAMVLIIIRLSWVKLSPPPALPHALAAKDQKIAKAMQGILYLLMLVLPISGYIMSTAAGYPVPFFGLFNMPALISENEALAGFAHEAHHLMGFFMIAIILLHVIGAIKHRIKDKGGETDILQRML